MAKYQLTAADRFRMRHDIIWPEHAADRWAERVASRWPEYPPAVVAFGAGEWVDHEDILAGEHADAERAKVYHQAAADGSATGRVVVFLLARYSTDERHRIRTVVRADQYQHRPTRAYLYTYGPHEVGA